MIFLQKLIYDRTLITIHDGNVFYDINLFFAIIIAQRKQDHSGNEAVKCSHLMTVWMKRTIMDGIARSCQFPVYGITQEIILFCHSNVEEVD